MHQQAPELSQLGRVGEITDRRRIDVVGLSVLATTHWLNGPPFHNLSLRESTSDSGWVTAAINYSQLNVILTESSTYRLCVWRAKVMATSSFLTSSENVALNLIFASRGESRFNRTPEDYRRIAAGLPKVEALHAEVNEHLRDMAAAGYAPTKYAISKRVIGFPGTPTFQPRYRSKPCAPP
jgi:hypothetical protein